MSLRHLRKWLGGLATCLALATPEPVQAANNTVIDSIRYFPTYHSIGIRVYYSGADDDTNATVVGTIKRVGAAGVDSLPRFVRTHWNAATGPTRKYWATSALWCGPDTTYTINIAVTDAGGCTGCTPGDQNVTTWAEPVTNAATNTVWMGPFGDDANSGANAANPKRTFAACVTALVAAGGQIRMLAGTYYAQRTDSLHVGDDAKNGTIADRYSVVADGGLGSVTLSGADTTALSGAGWGSKTVYSGVTAYVKTGFAAARYPRHVGVDDTLRLWPAPTFYKFCTDPLGIATNWGLFWVTGDGDSVFIRLPGGASPSGKTIHVPMKAAAIRIGSAFWRINGLIIKDFGTGFNAASGISHSVVNLSNQGNIVENCRFLRNNRPAVGIRAYSGATSLRTQWNLIQRNEFIETLMSDPWTGSVTASTGVGASRVVNNSLCPADTTCLGTNTINPTVIIENGRGHVLRYNYVRGGPDGFPRISGSAVDTVSTATTDIDIYRNTIINVAGDVIEPDQSSGLNTRVWKNVILGGYSALSYTMTRGPLYFVFNTGINQRGAVQVTGADLNENRGHLFVVNNSFFSRGNHTTALWAQPSTGTQNVYVNKVFVNNALHSTVGPLYYEAGCLNKNEFNWNKIAHGGGTFATTNYSAARPITNLTGWRDSTYTYGKNDATLTSLVLMDSTRWDWSPAVGSELTTGARTMPGINTRLENHGVWYAPSGELYVGAWGTNGMQREGLVLFRKPFLRRGRR